MAGPKIVRTYPSRHGLHDEWSTHSIAGNNGCSIGNPASRFAFSVCVANEMYTNFLKSTDQQARRTELLAFIGPNPKQLMKTYDQQVAMANRAPGEKPAFSFGRGFIWPVFFIGPVWFFYRKMWSWGTGIMVLVILVGLLPIHSGGLGLGLSAGLSAGGSLLYVNYAVRKIEAMRAARGGGLLDLREVAAAGGVSKTAGWIGGTIYGILILLGLFSAVYLILHPEAAGSGFPGH